MSLYKFTVNPATGDLQLVPTGTILAFKSGVANFASLPLGHRNLHFLAKVRADGLTWKMFGKFFGRDGRRRLTRIANFPH